LKKVKKKRGGQPVPFPKKQYSTRLKLSTIAWLQKQKNVTQKSAAQTIEEALSLLMNKQ